MKTLQVQPLKTDVFQAGESLVNFILKNFPEDLIQEKMVLAVTSKIVSLAENRLVPRNSVDKAALIEKEADVFLGEVGYGCYLTVKEGLFIPSAGIDESNSANDDFILYPADPFLSAKKLWEDLRSRWNLKELGIVLTDSHTSPLRQGVTGICLSCWGFHPVRNMIGTKDIFGRELKMTKMNLADGLASAAVMTMGEGRECRPLALITGADVDFAEVIQPNDLRMPLEMDLYYPLLKGSLPDSKVQG